MDKMVYNLTDRQVNSAPRQSNIELLRIIAILGIIAHHFAVHSGFEFSRGAVTVNRVWCQFLQLGGKIGVDVFFLISGYFLITAPRLKINKVFKFWLQAFTYSISIFAVFCLTGLKPFGWQELIGRCLPIVSDLWSFTTTYFLLYLLSPFLNQMLHAFAPQMYQRYLTLLTVLWCVTPTFLRVSPGVNYLLWGIYLYSLAGYIRLFPAFHRDWKAGTLIGIAAGLALLTWLSAVCLDFLGTKRAVFARQATMLFGRDQLPIVLISVLLLMGFSRLKMGYHRGINAVSAATFGVYLLHDDNYVRPFLWKTLFQNAAYADSPLLIPYSLAVIAVVFVSCMLVEWARIFLLEKRYMPLVRTLACKTEKTIERIFSYDIWNKI